ncbi:YeeE/YedE thiosulfate transporter family protein [Candidatus Magnetomonas plexicatena]|uniref:YeeE/YedE thiosulfate transporter family protein n=1 Tax=Candidatus Magnetomonas plexicatena TaxID=2552947 RepID=UPI0011019EFB|nr:YeeE/YedE family protein [Nitrospirales bacterium LBB_01]
MLELVSLSEFLKRLSNIFDPDTIAAVKGASSLYGGLILGLLFGVVLQKGRLCKYDTVSGLFRLQDFTVFRLGTPILMVSMVLVYILTDMGIIELHVPKTVIVPQIVGGLMFGAAIAILGYCPGTAAGALGEGALDSIPAIAGMMAGAAIYAEFFHDEWSKTFLTWGNIGSETFAELLQISPWYLIVLFLLMAAMFLLMMTMFDWMLVFLRKTFNMYMDLTDALEEKVPPAVKQSQGNVSETVRNLKKNIRDIFSK